VLYKEKRFIWLTILVDGRNVIVLAPWLHHNMAGKWEGKQPYAQGAKHTGRLFYNHLLLQELSDSMRTTVISS
jgi:hypothetical protein